MARKTLTLEKDFSVVIDTDGVELYTDDSDHPSITWDLEELLQDFVDSRLIAGVIAEPDIKDVRKVQRQLAVSAQSLNEMINKSLDWHKEK